MANLVAQRMTSDIFCAAQLFSQYLANQPWDYDLH
jgi:hypothetical protein